MASEPYPGGGISLYYHGDNREIVAGKTPLYDENGDKVIVALGKALKKDFGLTAAVGRHSGHEFVILRQIHENCEVALLEEWIRRIAAGGV